MDVSRLVRDICVSAREASLSLARASTADKDRALDAIAAGLERDRTVIQAENEKDLAHGRQASLSAAMLDRLRLDDKRMKAMIQGVHEVIALKDPVGRVFDSRVRPNGLKIYKLSVPIGVIGIIYESRPNVTVDASILTLKTGNAVILRGGSESINSNLALDATMGAALESAGLPRGSIQVLPTTERAAVGALLKMDDLVDLIIPRGGEELIRRVVAESTIPVIKHYNGICHVYVDRAANLEMASDIVMNAKVQRPGVCNAMETLLVDSKVAECFLPLVLPRLRQAGVKLVGCERSRAIDSQMETATEQDWKTEYLDLILSVRVVDGLEGAVGHINRYGSRHTDAIVTQNAKTAREFIKRVDSSSVMVNASTRFSDGGQYGLGAEIGISTDKLHARGPMGLAELTTYKWVVVGKGQLRE
jgi:glutamate-5-semialdehyde dehydrogenase